MSQFQNCLGLVIAAVAASACHPEPPSPLVVPVDRLVHLSPCDILPETGQRVGNLAKSHGYPHWNGHEVVTDSTNPRMRPDTNVSRNLVNDTVFSNEVHDCQRLVVVVDDTLTFGPLVGLLPLRDAMDSVDAAFDRPQPVATVYNWGGFRGEPEIYERPRIEHRRNCLWLRRHNEVWSAALSRPRQGACFEEAAPHDTMFKLDVQRAIHRGPMPKTARWEWSATDSVHIMGIKCGSAWCRIGPDAIWAADTIHLPVGRPDTTIPGYFDEQHLAIPGGEKGIIPGAIGRVTPTDTFFALAQAQLSTPHQDVMGPEFANGLEVATIDLRGAPVHQTYYDLWGFWHTPLTLHVMVPKMSDGTDFVGGERSTFRDRTGLPGRSVRPIRIDNSLHASIGSVRWRWHDTSATASIWSACGDKGMDCCDTR